MPKRLLLTVPEVARVLGLGKSKVWELVMAGQIESVQIGRARRVSTQAVEEYVDRLHGEAEDE